MSPEPMTADELWGLDLPDRRSELQNGRLIVREPPGFEHGHITWKLAHQLSEHVVVNGLGILVSAETGFILRRAPDTVRAPDIAFVRRERIPEPIPKGYAEFAPDLAVEVLSPDDRPGAVLAKVADWLNGGTRQVWIVDPTHRTVRVYREDGSQALIDDSESLNGEDVVPGFSCEVKTIF